MLIYLYVQFWIEIENSKQYDRECGHTSYTIGVRTSSITSKLVPGPFKTLQLQPNISSLEYPEDAKKFKSNISPSCKQQQPPRKK
jgi:hypothetical protein